MQSKCAPPPLTEECSQQLKNYPKEDVIDGGTAAAHVAYACSDAAFIYPITPSSVMAEIYEVWASQKRLNVFGDVCTVRQLQSEAGAAGAVHGSLSVGAVTTTFTASQGLLLMIPPMYKIAGELIPCVFHVSARAIAGQALSIFGDHSDVMAVRQCGWVLLSSATVQEAQDLAVISHMATLLSRVPFVHFFDGFRTSHEVQKIKLIDYTTIRDLLDFQAIQSFRDRALNPTHPYTKGSSQGPEVYFQNVEVANRYYSAVPSIVEQCFDKFAKVIGRRYDLFKYYGAADAEDIIVIMGAGGPVIEETIDYMADHYKRKAGLVTVKLYRPWCLDRFIEALPSTTKRICVMDRTKEAGSLGEPLFLDVATSLQQKGMNHIKCVGGRFGLGSKDFNPAMVVSIYDNLCGLEPKHGFTVGIDDDLTGNSLLWRHISIDTVPAGTTQCMFWGMGSDGTVGANKNVIKILGQNTDLQVQGYFAYSAHKAGGLTVSHLRFGPEEIKSQYLLQSSDYVAVHRQVYIQKYNCYSTLKDGGIFVLNTDWTDEQIDEEIPWQVKHFLASKRCRFFTLDANKVAVENGMGRRINNVLMTAFFKLSGVLPFEEAISLFKAAIAKTYGKKGKHVVEANWKCVDAAVDAIHEVEYDAKKWLRRSNNNGSVTSAGNSPTITTNVSSTEDTTDDAVIQTTEDDYDEFVSSVSENVQLNQHELTPLRTVTNSCHIPEPPTFVQGVMFALDRMEGELLPTSAFTEFEGGIIPPGTAGYEKRAIALNVPVVNMDNCTQCNQCAFVCPHSAIRPFLIDDEECELAPSSFVTKKVKGPQNIASFKYRIQVSPLDCTGCELCYIACPDNALKMVPLNQAAVEEEPNWNFAITLKDRSDHLDQDQRETLKGSQFSQPLVEFSGACEGCGETPYVKLLTQLFGERLVIANATGCSSIWAASYPANAYTINQKGQGPAWGNSLFEDNAEYGYGMAISATQRRARLRETVERALNDSAVTSLMSETLRSYLSEWLLHWKDARCSQRCFEKLRVLLPQESKKHPLLAAISSEKDMLPRQSHWIIGGDGWAYDIGYGGLDHVLASGADVNVLVLDTEVYSNTGGQQSKATTLGAVHKFATGGRLRNKKDLGALVMEYGDVYVASVASSANMSQTVRAFVEAEAYDGPSMILAYSPCIEHQYIKPFNLQLEHCKLAVDSGYWPLYRFDPSLADAGKNAFQLDSRKIKATIVDLMKKENRFGTLRRSNPELATELEAKLQEWALQRFNRYKIRALGYDESKVGKEEKKSVENQWNVIYGSETGTAEDVAKRIGVMLQEREIPAVVTQMDELSVEEVSAMERVLVVCSTAGQGDLPGNAKELFESLSKETASDLLVNTTYAVMGLGDSNYVFFNTAAKKFDELLKRLGGQRLIDPGLGDDQAEEGYETALGDFLSNFWQEAKIGEPKNVPNEPTPSTFVVAECKAATYKQCIPLGCQVIELRKNERMTPKDYSVDVRHLEFDLLETNIKYALGDSLAIWPENDEEKVKEFCTYFGFQPDQWIKLTPRAQDASSGGASKLSKLFENPMTVKQLFVECLDIFGKPNRSFYSMLYRYCADEQEKSKAKEILSLENKQNLTRLVSEEYVNHFDVLKIFKSTKSMITIERLVDLIPVIKPRYYSIASCQKFVGPTNLHLCVGIVEWTTKTNKEKRLGQATGFISRTNSLPKSFRAAIKSTAFNLPPTDRNPIIVAGMGTGLAPFRSFIQHRAWLQRTAKTQIGPLIVYFGCRYKSKDFLYQQELEQYHKQGIITHLKTAFSRDQKEKHYIQHEILNDPQLFYQTMLTQDGYFYLCGSAKQVPIDVRNAVIQVLTQQDNNLTPEKANQLVTQWQIQGKYNVEAWS